MYVMIRANCVRFNMAAADAQISEISLGAMTYFLAVVYESYCAV